MSSILTQKRQSARFITRDYHSREEGCMTQMLKDLDLPTLQQRRKELRLSLLFKIADGSVQAIPSDKYLKPVKKSRQITPKNFDGYEYVNKVEKYVTNNSRCFKIPSTNNPTGPYSQSFFPRTVMDWNQLDDELVLAGSVDSFRTHLKKQRQF